jgi:hypothetical protein
MTRLFSILIVFGLVSPALGGDDVAQDKNWGDKQTRAKATAPELKEKNAKFGLEKEKMEPMKSKKK